MSTPQEMFAVQSRGSYIEVEFLGKIDSATMAAATDEILKIHNTTALDSILCDIRKLNYHDINIRLQIEGVGLLWKVRHFQKFAFIVEDKKLRHMVQATVEQIHIAHKHQAFSNKAAAIAWLENTN